MAQGPAETCLVIKIIVMDRKITLSTVLSEGTAIGLKNLPSLIGATLLWILTIWIPYINVGTTIAMQSIPCALSKGEVISPLFIFDGKYRKYMGEFFTLIGLQSLSIIPALLFMIVPGIIISLGWSLSLYILLDKGVGPSEAMVQSNNATYGYKWTMFLSSLVLVVAFYVVALILTYIVGLISSALAALVMLALVLCLMSISLGMSGYIYRKLALEETPAE